MCFISLEEMKIIFGGVYRGRFFRDGFFFREREVLELIFVLYLYRCGSFVYVCLKRGSNIWKIDLGI